jgi:hypothetical protein
MKKLDCGHEPSPHGEHTTGTAHTQDGREICWDCANTEQREDLKTAPRFMAYTSQDWKSVTDWTGRLLGSIRWKTSARNAFCGTLYHLRVVDVHGQRWAATTLGPGMYCRMRRLAT